MNIISEEEKLIKDIIRFYGAEEQSIKLKLLTATVISETEKIFKEERNG